MRPGRHREGEVLSSLFRNLLAAAVAAGACAVPTDGRADLEYRFRPPPSRLEITLPPKDPAQVQVLSGKLRRSIVPLGFLGIKGDAHHSHEELIEYAKRLAAERGADYIVISDRSGLATQRSGGPTGAVSGFGTQRRGSEDTFAMVDVLRVSMGGFPKATLGIGFENVMRTGRRLIVRGFKPGGWARSAGIAVGDEITQVDGVPADYYDARFEKWRLTSEPGQVARLKVLRNGVERTVDVTLVANDGDEPASDGSEESAK